ncbi:hypothetical protein BGX38DRAFT_1274328 [Terfezia claveryi]|nr:hypothetical protein BGX38DRAFT_1274328 [Terfezia claveryi]
MKDYCVQQSIRSWALASHNEKDALVIGLKLHWDEEYYEKSTSSPGTAVAFWVGDSEIGGHRDINGWIWDVRNRRNMGVIENKTLDEDSYTNVCNIAGVRRRHMPTRDHTFEQRKHELRARVACQEETLREVKREHKRLFPTPASSTSIMRITATFSPQTAQMYHWSATHQGTSSFTSSSFQEDTEGEDDEDTILQPPHLALSSKRLAESDRGRPARKLRIDYGAPKTPRSAAHPSSSAAHPLSSAVHPSSLRQRSSPPPLSTGRGQPRTYHTESSASDMPSDIFSLNSKGHTQEEEELGLTIQKPPCVGPRSRSFFSVPDEYKELVCRAASYVQHYTLFGNPMLNAEEIQQLLSVTWVKAQEETGETLPRLKINAHPRRVHMLLLAAIKADIRTCLAAAQQKGCLELDQPIEVGDTSAFEAELMQELLQATRAARITWQRIPDAFHQQVDQREEEDHSRKFTSFYTHNSSEKANSNSHMETDVEAAEHETDNELEEETDDN